MGFVPADAATFDTQSVKTTESGDPAGYDAGKKARGRKRHMVAYFNQIAPYFAGGEEAFTACRPAADLRLFSVAQFNEFKDRLLNAHDGIADARRSRQASNGL